MLKAYEAVLSKDNNGKRIAYVKVDDDGVEDVSFEVGSWEAKWCMRQTDFDKFVFFLDDSKAELTTVLKNHGITGYKIVDNSDDFIEQSK